ncbi:DUF536 domain-containing protein [Streptococcaceae bacterium ESL0729]|nr:DUF536 domain-containing protein [Streptococcaceae bacterium ESL0729]
MDLKTVSELSDLFGVTRQAMNNRVKKLPGEYVEKNEKGTTVVNINGIKELENIYGKKVTFKPEEEGEDKGASEQGLASLLTSLMEDKNAEIRRLNEQLRVKDSQLATKDNQIAIKDQQIFEKDKQLDQQQQLTAKAMADSEQLRLDSEQLKLDSEQLKEDAEKLKTDLDTDKKKGFFAKLFGKKENVKDE